MLKGEDYNRRLMKKEVGENLFQKKSVGLCAMEKMPRRNGLKLKKKSALTKSKRWSKNSLIWNPNSASNCW